MLDGGRPKPPITYFKALFVKILWEIFSLGSLLRCYDEDLSRLCRFDNGPPSRTGIHMAEAGLDEPLFDEALNRLKMTKHRFKKGI